MARGSQVWSSQVRGGWNGTASTGSLKVTDVPRQEQRASGDVEGGFASTRRARWHSRGGRGTPRSHAGTWSIGAPQPRGPGAKTSEAHPSFGKRGS